MKKIFIAATKQNDGKTSVSLGLMSNFKDRFRKVAFIKPIGQRYLEEDGVKVDEDSILIEKVCGFHCKLKDMSPIAVEKGFTEKYITSPDKRSITAQIKEAYRRISKGQDLVIIEGTGHAGVGSVFEHSNASVAKLLGAKVIIISSGGVGRPIDEIILNKALFDKEGVKVLGVIVNKVLPTKFDKISELVRKGLSRQGIKVLGVIPYDPMLSRFTIEQILEETKFKLVCGKDFIEKMVSSVVVGAMQSKDAVKYIVDDSLLITPGDREDIIKVALEERRTTTIKEQLKIAGIILSGGIKPAPEIMELLCKAEIPVLFAEEDTYAVASIVHDLTVKIRFRDTDKINRIIRLVRSNVDVGTILKGM
ncbi:MAG TPA: AAA family ATPase [Candidatus Omnitrophota bacterium]|nr:AAA family ATPase [Candidatus Omnitrophota bacterium]HPT07724.1 AAA family ATPase [Candidatus Omnitrophota bacterium]